MKMAEYIKANPVEAFLEYGKQFEQKPFASKAAVTPAVDKLVHMLKEYGFEYNGGFNIRCRPIPRTEDTTSFYKLTKEDGSYIEVQVGFLYDHKYKGKKSIKQETTKGVFRVMSYSGKPGPKIGDIETVDGAYTRIYTSRGWYSGD